MRDCIGVQILHLHVRDALKGFHEYTHEWVSGETPREERNKMKNMIQVAVLVLAASPAFAQTGTSAKGIYLDTGENRRPAMRFNVELYRDGEQTTVPTTFAFRDGDRMRFRFELNRDCYVYVLHRTVSSSIILVRAALK